MIDPHMGNRKGNSQRKEGKENVGNTREKKTIMAPQVT
jgi:hypothetical protein